MKKYTLLFGASLVVAGMSFVACGGDKNADAREVALVPPAQAPTTPPVINDAPPPVTPPVTPPRKSSKPPAKSTPPAVTPPVVTPPVIPPVIAPPSTPLPKYAEVPTGTEFAVRPTVKVCTNTQKVGDRVDATVAEAITTSDGAKIPAGSTAKLEVTTAQFGNNDANAVKLDFRVISISFGGDTYDVSADAVSPPVTKVRRQSNAEQAGKIAAGAAVGAVIGKIIGKSGKATAGGAVVGAAGGVAAAKGTADYDGCVAAEARIAVKLTQSLRVRVVS